MSIVNFISINTSPFSPIEFILNHSFSEPSMDSGLHSFWCNQCKRMVTVESQEALSCPHFRDAYFNPVIVLRNASEEARGQGYQFYYDDRSGAGIRALPSSVSESLAGSGSGSEATLERVLDIGFSMLVGPENQPASKRAVASLPAVQVQACHVDAEPYCAVCTDAFVVGRRPARCPASTSTTQTAYSRGSISTIPARFAATSCRGRGPWGY